jgi:hypothetical protein
MLVGPVPDESKLAVARSFCKAKSICSGPLLNVIICMSYDEISMLYIC